MRGDEKPDAREAEAGTPRRAKSGPRHAAPRKSVLSRLQVPAGKAIALAAMPTAVLMGMGFTPQLANANPRAEDRFKAGPCVSRSDEAERDDKAGQDSKDGQDDKAGQDGKDSKDDKAGQGSKGDQSGQDDTPGQDGGRDTGEDGGTDATTPKEPSDTQEPPPSRETGDGADGAADAPEDEPATGDTPAPSGEDAFDPLDPLGLGQKIEDLLTGGDGAAEQPAGSTTPDPATTPEPDRDPGPEDTADAPAKEPERPAKTAPETTDEAQDAVEDVKDAVDDAAKDAEQDAGKDTGKDTGDAAGDSASKPAGSSSPDAADLSGYPCPEYDAEAYENAEGETTEALLPEDPWVLRSSRLALHGLAYDGIVEVKTYSGKVKKVLKFTASGVDIKDLHQLVVGPGGTTTHVEARKGSTSTIRNGTVTMYTEELSGNLLGLIPVTFSPKSPPPLTFPELFFTDVKVTQAGQFGGDLTVPGMHLYKTGG